MVVKRALDPQKVEEANEQKGRLKVAAGAACAGALMCAMVPVVGGVTLVRHRGVRGGGVAVSTFASGEGGDAATILLGE